MEYGFITELIGRLPVVVSLDSLYKGRPRARPYRTQERLRQAVPGPLQHRRHRTGLHRRSLEASAEQAISQKAGARGLRTILEKTLLDVMYELPGTTGIKKCIVEAGAVNGTSPIILETGEGHSIPLHMTPHPSKRPPDRYRPSRVKSRIASLLSESVIPGSRIAIPRFSSAISVFPMSAIISARRRYIGP